MLSLVLGVGSESLLSALQLTLTSVNFRLIRLESKGNIALVPRRGKKRKCSNKQGTLQQLFSLRSLHLLLVDQMYNFIFGSFVDRNASFSKITIYNYHIYCFHFKHLDICKIIQYSKNTRIVLIYINLSFQPKI